VPVVRIVVVVIAVVTSAAADADAMAVPRGTREAATAKAATTDMVQV
jgi:hypothetical protein